MALSPVSSHGGAEVASGAVASLQNAAAGFIGGVFSLDTEEKDTDGYWSLGAPGAFQIPTGLDGLFVVTAYAEYAADVLITSGTVGILPSGAAPNTFGAMIKDLAISSFWQGGASCVVYAVGGQHISYEAVFSGPASVTLRAGTFAAIARIGSLP